ncbi:MAG: hypothetical protein K2P85_00465 [Flavobacteriaceae bacterium]|nr:hypothetical protein [Flavobacteriaceae bacterium]
METTEKKPIKLADLSAEEKKQLLKEAAAEERELKANKSKNSEAYKQLSADFVTNNIDIFAHRQIAIENDIKNLFTDYKAIIDIKAMVYGEKVHNQDTHTSTLADGSASITIGNNVSINFDGTEKIGIEGIKEYIASLTDDDENTAKLTQMVNILLKPNKQGMLNPSSIIQLNGLRGSLNSEKFNENLDIIEAAQIRVKSTMFVSGWKFIEIDGITKKLEFRFSI